MSNMNPNPFQPKPAAPTPPAPTPAAPTPSAPTPAAPTPPAPTPAAPIPSAPTPAATPSTPTTAQSTSSNNNKNRPPSYLPPTNANFVCPFCLENIQTSELVYYCKFCNNTYTENEAHDIGLYRKPIKQFICCGASITGSRICPNCEINAISNNIGFELLRMIPTEFYERKSEFRLCMTGYSASGKTQYITQLLQYISTHLTPSVNNTRFLDHKTQEIRDAILKKFFVDAKLASTPRGYLDPLLYSIDSKSGSHKSVFYDIAGETFSRPAEDLQQIIIQKCVWTSKNIILIIDPTTLDGVQNDQNIINFRNVAGQASDCKIADPLNSYIGFVLRENPDKDKFLKKVNIAVVFTKMDLFANDPDLHQLIKNESNHLQNGSFNIREIEDVNREMSNWIHKKGGGQLTQAIKSYPNVKIFGVSSGSENLAIQKRTNRLLDPYLWLLYKNGILN